MSYDVLVRIGANTADFSRALTNASKDISKFGQKMKDVGGKMTKFATLPLAGLGAAAVKTGMDFEAGMSKVAAISGATGDEIEALTEKAREIGKSTKFSASEASEALSFMSMSGWDTQQMLEGIDGVMALAAASGEDLAMVSDILTDSLTAFGMSAEQSSQFADVLAAAASNANTDVYNLGESFKYVAPLAGAMGYTAEDTSKALSLMANAGIKGSQAGTSLKTMLTNLASPTNQMKEAMQQLGISIKDSNGDMKSLDQLMLELRSSFAHLDEAQQASYASTIFGKEAMSGALAIINASASDYDKLSEAIANSDGVAAEMAETMQDNLLGRLTEMKSALEEAAIVMYDALQPALEVIVEAIKRLAEWFTNLSPEMQNAIVIIAGIVAVAGPLLVILGTLASSVSALMPLFAALTGPIGLVIAAIGLLTAAGIALYTNWNTIKAKAVEIWDAIKTQLTRAVNAVRDKMRDIKDRIKNGWNSAVKFLKGINLRSIGRDIIQGLINGIKSKIAAVGNAVKSVTSQITGKIKSILKISSPSRLLDQYGRWTGEGLVGGIERTIGAVSRVSDEMATAAVPEISGISLAYSTPSGMESTLARAVSGTVDVRSNEHMIANAIHALEHRLANLEIVMDERVVGAIVEPHISGIQDRKGFRKRTTKGGF